MLYQDLMEYNSRSDAIKGAIENKYKAEMVYYLVIEEVLSRYGTDNAKNMQDFHPDALGCARDQMAMLASDQRLVQYDNNGRIYDLGRDRLRNLMLGSFKNSEALRATVSTHLATNDLRSESMSDDELYEAVNREFDRMMDLSDENSCASAVWRKIQAFDDYSNDTYSPYAFYMRPEQIMRDGTSSSKAPINGNQRTALLKISPLAPEIRTMRMIGFSELGLTDEPEPKDNNKILMFDTQKQLLFRLPETEAGIRDFHGRAPGMDYQEGVMFGESEYGRTGRQYNSSSIINTDENGNEIGYRNLSGEGRLYAPERVVHDLNNEHAWRFAHILETYSGQNLTPDDYDLIREMFQRQESQDATMFGHILNDGLDQIQNNANAYFDYLEHVCSDMKRNMQSHEFEIHLAKERTPDVSGLAVKLWFTGERTQDYNKARANQARFSSVFIYTDYTPKNYDVSPVIGDVMTGGRESYLVTNTDLRRNMRDENIRNLKDHPYFHATKMDTNKIINMRRSFDAYMNTTSGRELPERVELRKIMRTNAKKGMKDPSEYIRDDGTVNSRAILSELMADLSAIKASQRMDFQKESNVMHFDNIMNAFRESREKRYHAWHSDDESDIQADTGEQFTLGMAFRSLEANSGDEMTPEKFRNVLRKELDKFTAHELRESYAEDVNSYTISMHLFRKYTNLFVDRVYEKLLSENDLQPDTPLTPRAVNYDALAAEVILGDVQSEMMQPNNKLLEEGLSELFGSSDRETNGKIDRRINQHLVIKPNMCKYVSTRLYPGDYNNMMTLLSYTDDAEYEDDARRQSGELYSRMSSGNNANENKMKAVFQVYDMAAFENVDDNDTDEPDQDLENAFGMDELDNTGSVSNATFDDRLWYLSTFADTNDPDDVSYQWLTDNTNLDPDVERERAVYVATHPLQMAALSKVDASLSGSEGRYDRSRLKINSQGVIYYHDQDDELVLKIGPVVDERAYIRPYVSENPEGAHEITRIKRDSAGFPERDDGMAVQETIKCDIVNDYVIRNGRLMNDVVFGALDTQILTKNRNAVLNRFYGVSAKVDGYDGYNHTGKSFTNRLSFATYKTSVLEGIDRQLAVYRMSKRNSMNSKVPRSIGMLEVSGGSLNKYYRTNTYLMGDKAKCMIADAYMSGYLDGTQYDVLGEYRDDDVSRNALENVANLSYMQSKMYHDRVVMPKIDIDQNIGLYNQVINLPQCSNNNLVGTIDRKSMRNTDSKSARVAAFSPNPMFDSVLSATAKQLGAVAFFTDAVDFDDMTGNLRMDTDAGNDARCVLVSTGIENFATDNIECRTVNYLGSQAPDRLQLSCNAVEKALNYSEGVKFAMIGLGYNMEDGYVVAKRSAEKFGHFDEQGVYHKLQLWDKIGDTESGNKGVVSKIVDTDIGAGMDDAMANEEFDARFLIDFMRTYDMNYGSLTDPVHADFKNNARNVGDYLSSMINMPGGDVFEKFENARSEKFKNLGDAAIRSGEMGIRRAFENTPAEMEARLQVYYEGIENDKQLAEQELYEDLRPCYAEFASALVDAKIEPFYGQYMMEKKAWQLFRDNPDLDIAITNVCVLTRSNPSLLEYITDAHKRDVENGISAGGVDVNDDDSLSEMLKKSDSILVVRDENGQKKAYDCACGRYNIYVDVNTSDHKNKDYTSASRKTGRKYGSQEMYALQAKHCNNDFIRFITYNDPTLPDRIAKLNRRLIMNGMIFNPSTGDLQAQTLTQALRDSNGDPIMCHRLTDEDDSIYHSSSMPGFSFIDMREIAKTLVDGMPGNVTQAKYENAVKSISEELDFGKFFTVKDRIGETAEVASKMSEDVLRHMFVASFARYGGNFMLMPESLGNLRPNVYHELKSRNKNDRDMDSVYVNEDMAFQGYNEFDEYMSYDMAAYQPYEKTYDGTPFQVRGDVVIANGDGELVKKACMPLFMSSKESLNSETETVTSYIEDRLQFQMFETVLGGALLDELKSRNKITDKMYSEAAQKLGSKLTDQYASISSGKQKSLEIKDMSKYMKKNIYTNIFPNSLTCVWSGDPTVEIDQVGMSFEKAKTLGILHYKKNLTKEMRRSIPDTWENFDKLYEPIKDDDLVLINRSPGQTTGCIRAMHPFIYGPTGDGIKVNPAVATIFDGDFDGDTIGVINPFVPSKKNMTKEETQTFNHYMAAAKRELMRTMTMQANMVHTADYTEIKINDDDMIKFVNPLFIAKNADYAVALKHMKESDDPSQKIVSDKIDAITVTANIIEQSKQLIYDYKNYKTGAITEDMFCNLLGARDDQVYSLKKYFTDKPTSGELKKFCDGCNDITENMFKLVTDIIQSDNGSIAFDELFSDVTRKIQEAEKANKEQLSKVYRELNGHMAIGAQFVHGEDAFEMLKNIVASANDSKKGKEPQLKALAVYSDLKDVVDIRKNSETGFMEVVLKPGKSPEDVVLRRTNDCDVPKNELHSQLESHTIAQSDKSDATGLGGSMAQKMQKLFAKSGYSELGLRISGPITQAYLDAKQNVVKCEKNLKIGKFLLPKICNFERIKEFSNEYLSSEGGKYCETNDNKYTGDAVRSQVYNGQYTFYENNDRYMTPKECANQMNNFLQIMGQPEFSPIDRAIVESVLSQFTEEKEITREVNGKLKKIKEQVVVRPIQKSDEIGDQTYAAMYGASSDNYASLMSTMIDKGYGLYTNSIAYDHTIDTDRIRQALVKSSIPNNIKKTLDYCAESEVTKLADEVRAQEPLTREQQQDNAFRDNVGTAVDPTRASETVRERQEDIKNAYDGVANAARPERTSKPKVSMGKGKNTSGDFFAVKNQIDEAEASKSGTDVPLP